VESPKVTPKSLWGSSELQTSQELEVEIT